METRRRYQAVMRCSSAAGHPPVGHLARCDAPDAWRHLDDEAALVSGGGKRDPARLRMGAAVRAAGPARVRLQRTRSLPNKDTHLYGQGEGYGLHRWADDRDDLRAAHERCRT